MFDAFGDPGAEMFKAFINPKPLMYPWDAFHIWSMFHSFERDYNDFSGTPKRFKISSMFTLCDRLGIVLDRGRLAVLIGLEQDFFHKIAESRDGI